MRIGIVGVDGHHFPNLPLRIRAGILGDLSPR